MSLGVDLIPHKICSLNCVYCECGPSTHLTRDRKEYVPVEDVLNELKDFFQDHADPNYITFSGAGEPTLHSRLGDVIDFITSLRPEIPIAVLTNGSLLDLPEVREELSAASIVLPSLDAATDSAFNLINRPVKQFSIDTYIQGLIDFRESFQGEIWLEILIIPGYNDDPENLDALKTAVLKIQPDRIQLNTLDRPGAVSGIKAAPRDQLEQIAEEWGMDKVEIIAKPPNRHNEGSQRTDLENVILETLSRRPCTAEDLGMILKIPLSEIKLQLTLLDESGRIESELQARGRFYHSRNLK
jgi:wyosine [tRNA(Phe)-imidazoG37] synthetase (radical SAM superfamily)